MLAKLTAGARVEAKNCWEPGIVELAKEDGPKLRRAGRAASLAASAVLCMRRWSKRCKKRTANRLAPIHRNLLPTVIDEHAARARRVNMLDLIQDTGSLPDAVVEVLEKTIAWLAAGAKDVMALRDVYEHAECDRKGSRARLSRLTGAERRIEWRNSEHAAAAPLHFRSASSPTPPSRPVGCRMRATSEWKSQPYLDALRPEPGSSVTGAILTSYSADLPSIVAALLALAGRGQ